MSNQNYLALVLSPITDTITRARKTRELWGASFVFSRMMYQLLAHRPASTTIIAPAFIAQKSHAYGAGIYHDRCILKLEEGAQPNVTDWFKSAYAALANEMGTTEEALKRLIKTDLLKAEWKPDELAATAVGNTDRRLEDDAIAIHRLNRLLDNLELRPVYVPREDRSNLVDTLEKNIQALYRLGYEKGAETIFLPTTDKNIGRLPSLPEIGMRELRDHSDESIAKAYRQLVEDPFERKIEVMKALGGRGKDLEKKLRQLVEQGNLPPEYLEDSQIVNELFFTYLKKHFAETLDKKDVIRFRHKYVAVVQLDGDGLGKAITHISKEDPDGSLFNAFSKRLLNYADEAVRIVVEYGGLPVYAGGDDLLFLAPVAMPDNSGASNVLSLCAKLDKLFREKMEDDTLTLSGGVFVSYYKFPLGEAVHAAHDLEQKAKKFTVFHTEDLPEAEREDWKPRHKKQAIALEVRKHSGQTFGTTFHLGSASFPVLENILSFKDDLQEAFLTSAMHRLQSIPTLLADVARDDDVERHAAFRKHQFGKGGPKHEGEYLTKVLEYAHAVFASYGDALAPDKKKKIDERLEKEKRAVQPLDFVLTERIFAALRFKQFLIMPDHD